MVFSLGDTFCLEVSFYKEENTNWKQMSMDIIAIATVTIKNYIKKNIRKK